MSVVQAVVRQASTDLTMAGEAHVLMGQGASRGDDVVCGDRNPMVSAYPGKRQVGDRIVKQEYVNQQEETVCLASRVGIPGLKEGSVSLRFCYVYFQFLFERSRNIETDGDLLSEVAVPKCSQEPGGIQD